MVATEPLPPHPHLSRYYSRAADKHAYLRDLFDDTAADYDRIESALALGTGRWYRQRALSRAGLASGMKVLDVATGTGLVAREALRIVGSTGTVVGLDPSFGMLARAKSQLGIAAVLARGETLPWPDGTFDFLSMGYALRHLADLRQTFAEYARVLKPGGRLCVLEIVAPRTRVGRAAMRAYFSAVVPVVVRAVARTPQSGKLWAYYEETIRKCVPGAAVIEALEGAGFGGVDREVDLGIFAAYRGIKGSSA